MSRSSQWSPAETPQHHNQGTSYFPATSSQPSSWQHASPLNARNSSATRRGMRSNSVSSSQAASRRRRDDDAFSEYDELDTPFEVHEHGQDYDQEPRQRHRRPGKAVAPPIESADSGDSGDNDDDPENEREDDDPITVKERQSLINVEHPFGLPIWKPALYKKTRSVTRNADAALHSIPSAQAERHLLPGNLFWVVAFGWWLGVASFIVAAILYIIPLGGKKYARLVYGLGWYIAWPFGKYVEGDAPVDDEEGNHPWDGNADGLQVPEDHDAASTDTVRQRDDTQPRVQIAEQHPPRESSSLLRHRDSNLPAPSKSYGTTVYTPPDEFGTSAVSTQSKASDWLGKICFWLAFITILAPLLLIVCLICWALVVTIPMAKLNWQLIKYLFTRPFTIRFCAAPPVVVVSTPPNESADGANAAEEPAVAHFSVKHPRLSEGQLAPTGSPTSTVLLCVYKAVGLQYYKYTIGGVNILFVNLLPIVFFVIFDGFVLLPWAERLEHHGQHVPALLRMLTSHALIFLLSLLSVIPLSYFIGMAVASISAQSSIGMGAVINATFGSIIEIILYGIALTQGKGRLVEGSIVGSLLAGVLLMPGMSMCSMALRRKELRFNAKSAGVTSMMLIMAIIGCVAPTLFYQIYGNFQLVCSGCPSTPTNPGNAPWICDHCYYKHPDPVDDPFYQSTVKNLMFFCTGVLLLSYLIGLWFSLRTHASQIWQNPQPLMQPMELPTHGNRISQHNKVASNNVQGTQMPPLHRKGSNATNPEPVTSTGAREPSLGGASGPSYSPTFPRRVAYAPPVMESVDLAVKNADLANIQLPPAMTTDDFTRAVAVATVSALRHQQTHASTGKLRASVGDEAGGHGGHDAPSWSRTASASVLLACTALYALIAELLVDVVDVVLKGSGIDEKFLGVTLFALVPNTTEFMNAMSFALNGNIALSMEIGSAYALQVCLLQIPAMVAFSAWHDPEHMGEVAKTFSLIFPRWDVIAIILSMFLMTYTYIEAKSNYHRGSILILSYLVLLAGFYFAPPSAVDIDTGHLETLQEYPAMLSTWQAIRWYLTRWWY
ncbi:hypothetical protein CC1G_02972 [Coprinopsis cinerea okayama7|uniref:Calcium permease n=1 Tax=Coprinopsis cinerea (strain Okayama-7 / 130 / ATCC MYA-4618 / FGSC 9003) TaxID=240176 RepID=A8NRX9_COPC7|nr:hypothetical protein CC1G_02972 [Coprinopsis cinerea okayama7\|eukprot:XP_001835884.2 hypothetical protein CC1G_02972 [Coprinopsis cinerea okayama7\